MDKQSKSKGLFSEPDIIPGAAEEGRDYDFNPMSEKEIKEAEAASLFAGIMAVTGPSSRRETVDLTDKDLSEFDRLEDAFFGYSETVKPQDKKELTEEEFDWHELLKP